MKNELISIVIPIFNVEKYLENCINSVIKQTYKNIEIICIEDCSIDKSLEILMNLKEKDKRISVIQNYKNKGLSFSRNCGLNLASGKYIYFLDSDDSIDEICIETLYKIAECDNLEGVFFDYRIQDLREVKELNLYRPRKGKYGKIYEGLELLDLFQKNNEVIYGSQFQFWNKNFLNKNKIKFYEGIYHEDTLFLFQVLIYSKKVRCINYTLYNYSVRNNSITTIPLGWKHFEGIFLAYSEMIRIWSTFNNYTYNKVIAQYVYNIYLSVLLRYKKMERSNLKNHLLLNNHFADGLYQLFRITYEENKNDNFFDYKTIFKIKNYKTIIVYGAGKVGKKVLIELDNYEITNIFVAVSEIIVPKKILGYTINKIEEINVEHKSSIVIIATIEKYVDEIKNTLKKLGYENVVVAINTEEILDE